VCSMCADLAGVMSACRRYAETESYMDAWM